MEILEKCNLCPHECKINRNEGQIGRCKANNNVKIALYSIHNFEEPSISGKKGSGTVFFSNCNLNCIYCQNYEISQLGKGKEISVNRLAEIFLEQQRRNVENNKILTSIQWGYNNCTSRLNSLEGRVDKVYNSKNKSDMNDKRKHMEQKKNKPKINEYR